MSYQECTECGEDLDDCYKFGEDIKCKQCDIWLKTDMEEDWDSVCWWVVGKSDNQNQP